MFDLRRPGYDSPFEQLVGSLISIRTRDETTLPARHPPLRQARGPPREIAAVDEIDAAHLAGVTFPERQGAQIHAMSRRIVEEHGGELPRDVRGA